jgi:hypothetical protein
MVVLRSVYDLDLWEVGELHDLRQQLDARQRLFFQTTFATYLECCGNHSL